MGDPNRQYDFSNPGTYPTPFNFSGKPSGPVGCAVGFATQTLVNDPSNFMVSVVPPASAPVTRAAFQGALARPGRPCWAQATAMP